MLGAGGHAAIGWEIGLLAGMADAGIDVRDADVYVGTSAGSLVGVQITSGLTLEELFQRQVDPHLQTNESPPPIDFTRWRADFMRTKEGPGDTIAVLKRFGALALKLPADVPDVRRNMIAARLPAHTWPAVTIADRRYMDGGVYSIDNADLAMGCERVLILTLPARVPPLCVASLDTAVDTLKASGARVDVVHPDEASQTAFASVGGNLLDPSVREAAARAGREQGRSVAARVASLWR